MAPRLRPDAGKRWLDPIRYGILRPNPTLPRRTLEPLVQPSEAAIADAVRALVGQR